MASFRRSPEEAVRKSAEMILTAREYKLSPIDLWRGFLQKWVIAALIGSLALYVLGTVLKGDDLISEIIEFGEFVIVWFILWTAMFTYVKMRLRAEALKPEYDWAVEYSDEE